MFLPSILLCLLTVVAAFPGGYSTTPAPAPPQNDLLHNYQQKWSWFIRFADAFMYPNNTVQAQTINSTLFSENIQGRVDLTSTFDGRELNTEVSPSSVSPVGKAEATVYFRAFFDNCDRVGESSHFQLVGRAD